MNGFTSVLNLLAILAAVVGIIFYIASWFKPTGSSQLIFGMTKEQLITSANTLLLIALVLWVGAWFNQNNNGLRGQLV